MQSIVLEDIPFYIDLSEFSRELCIKEGTSYSEDLGLLVREAQRIGRPKAFYKLSFVEAREDFRVIIDGVVLTSRVLRANLEDVHRVFPYVATCGEELEQWSNGIENALRRYWAEAIKEVALSRAINFMKLDILERFRPGIVATMSPGSLRDWPIEEQRHLFSILGAARDMIGVHLSESLFMVPIKSVSGICFPTEEDFSNCQLCPRKTCPGRKAPYDAALWEKKYFTSETRHLKRKEAG